VYNLGIYVILFSDGTSEVYLIDSNFFILFVRDMIVEIQLLAVYSAITRSWSLKKSHDKELSRFL